MFARNIVSKVLSLSILALLLAVGAFVSPVAAHGGDNKYDRDDSKSSSHRRWSYAAGFRDGYRAGFRDGRSDAWHERHSERVRAMRRVDPRSPYDRGFEVAYERGYRVGFNSVSRWHDRDRDDDWDRGYGYKSKNDKKRKGDHKSDEDDD